MVCAFFLSKNENVKAGNIWKEKESDLQRKEKNPFFFYTKKAFHKDKKGVYFTHILHLIKNLFTRSM